MADDDGAEPDGAIAERPRLRTAKARSFRARLGHAFVRELHKDFQKGGQEVLAKLRKEKPLDYLKMVSTLLPEDMGGAEEEPKTPRLRRVVVRHRD